jgi:hypothetical protein
MPDTFLDIMKKGKYFTISGFLMALSAIVSLSGTMVEAAAIEVPRISIEQAKQIHDTPGVIFIDVRSAKSWWRSGTQITYAVRENPSVVKQWAPKYTKDQTLIFYCA